MRVILNEYDNVSENSAARIHDVAKQVYNGGLDAVLNGDVHLCRQFNKSRLANIFDQE